MTYANWKELLATQRLPCTVVDLQAFDENVLSFANLVNPFGKKIRVATKSIRVPELISRVLNFGAPYAGLMCFSCEEALFLVSQGFSDLLVTYPTMQTTDLKALRDAHEMLCSLQKISASLVVDSVEGVRKLALAMQGVSKPFGVVVEIDMSLHALGMHFGVRRSPIRTVEQLRILIQEILKHSELFPYGVMGYEAQVAGLPDQNPFKKALNPVASQVRKLSIRNSAKKREKFFEVFQEYGLEIFNGGGTGSACYSVEEPWLTEITVGSGFLCSHLFDYYSNLKLNPASFFALQVVRSSDQGYLTCQGGGYIASGEPGWDKVPLPYLPQGLKLVSMEGAGEVQTPVILARDTHLHLGDPVLFRHAKAGELAEHFQEYILISDGKIFSHAKTYRGHGKCFF